MSSEKRVYTTLDGLRGVAALLVLCFHNQLVLGRYWPAHGWLAVDLFFVLSGFVIDRAYASRFQDGLKITSFLKLRLIRLWPVYILGCALGLGFLVSLHVFSHKISWTEILFTFPNIVFLPAILTVNIGYLIPLNPPGWSLFFELIANIIYASLYSFITVRRLALLLAAIAVTLAFWAASGLSLQSGPMHNEVIGGLLRVGFSFFAGVLIARCLKERKGFRSNVLALAIMAPLVAGLSMSGGRVLEWLSMVVLWPLIVALATFIEPDSARLKSVFRLMGRLSYPVYALQYPLGITIQTLPKIIPSAMVFPIAMLLIVSFFAACYVLDRHYDEPVRRFLARRLLKKPPQAFSIDQSVRPF